MFTAKLRFGPTRWKTVIEARSNSPNTDVLIHIAESNIYRFGDSNIAAPVFQDVKWTVKEGENWAVIGSGSNQKTALLQTLRGHLRITPPPPPPGGLFPFLADRPRDPHTSVNLVSFAHRPQSSGGAFYDYTARYGAVRDEDRITLRESMFGEYDFLNIHLSARLGLTSLLDLPLVALSNGQTRRARIVKAILPRIIMGLRKQDPVPDWITHLALVQDGKVLTGKKEEMLCRASTSSKRRRDTTTHDGKPVIILKNVNVAYGSRKVLDSINWTVREGQRWHLQGANGSGKTTLLSLITGDHPQSYTQRGTSHLELFSRPRPRIPTPHLRSLIGVVSPELANAYPRRARTSVWEVIGTGFDGGFVPGGKHGVGIGVGAGAELTDELRQWRVDRVRAVLAGLGPSSWTATASSGYGRPSTASNPDPTPNPNHGPYGLSDLDVAFGERDFVDLCAGEQSIVLLMRALVGRPQLVLLDEVWSGMDDGMVRAARRYLRHGGVGPDQAVVVISHWEEEVPWSVQDGLRRFRLEDGNGEEV
ncbi:P-loop containing nucleoside triphosphate hydrolase protein [Phlebopus sp. FC_14]|nr:P-loop containing nucleoside triphosphate hydrolase protein [Phlebopus sp. FC_14]